MPPHKVPTAKMLWGCGGEETGRTKLRGVNSTKHWTKRWHPRQPLLPLSGVESRHKDALKPSCLQGLGSTGVLRAAWGQGGCEQGQTSSEHVPPQDQIREIRSQPSTYMPTRGARIQSTYVPEASWHLLAMPRVSSSRKNPLHHSITEKHLTVLSVNDAAA